jgi:hypothetical protein
MSTLLAGSNLYRPTYLRKGKTENGLMLKGVNFPNGFKEVILLVCNLETQNK